jgi:hypothetical protein
VAHQITRALLAVQVAVTDSEHLLHLQAVQLDRVTLAVIRQGLIQTSTQAAAVERVRPVALVAQMAELAEMASIRILRGRQLHRQEFQGITLAAVAEWSGIQVGHPELAELAAVERVQLHRQGQEFQEQSIPAVELAAQLRQLHRAGLES